jgi:cysteine desulfurase
MKPIYLDHHSTTPCDPRVVEAMLPFFTENFGNPAALTHVQGRRASNALEEARYGMARMLGVQPNELFITGGATESNNIALNLLHAADHLVTTAIEHKSVLAPVKQLRTRGVDVTIVKPAADGIVSIDAIREALRDETRMVSVMSANGEIGTLQPVEAIGALCRERGILFHTDATQAVGKIAVDFGAMSADLASLSAHKFYGPKGVGLLYSRRGIRIEPLVLGGGQEKNARSGTVNVPAVIGMARALELRRDEMAAEGERLGALRDSLAEQLLSRITGTSVNGSRSVRLPGNLNVSFTRIEADSLIMAMRRFALSSGSACSSGERGPSPVLTAIGLSDEAAMGSLRIGLGKANTAEEIDMLVNDLERAVARLREISVA